MYNQGGDDLGATTTFSAVSTGESSTPFGHLRLAFAVIAIVDKLPQWRYSGGKAKLLLTCDFDIPASVRRVNGVFLRWMEASSHLDVGHANIAGVDDGEVEDDGFAIVRKVVQIQVRQFPHLFCEKRVLIYIACLTLLELQGRRKEYRSQVSSNPSPIRDRSLKGVSSFGTQASRPKR